MPIEQPLQTLPELFEPKKRKKKRAGRKIQKARVRGTMNISEMDSQKTYETLPERMARGKQALQLVPSIESHSYISKIISD